MMSPNYAFFEPLTKSPQLQLERLPRTWINLFEVLNRILPSVLPYRAWLWRYNENRYATLCTSSITQSLVRHPSRNPLCIIHHVVLVRHWYRRDKRPRRKTIGGDYTQRSVTRSVIPGKTKLRSGNGAFRLMCQNLAPTWRGRKGLGESRARIGSRSEREGRARAMAAATGTP
jgi:hypothetical protein